MKELVQAVNKDKLVRKFVLICQFVIVLLVIAVNLIENSALSAITTTSVGFVSAAEAFILLTFNFLSFKIRDTSLYKIREYRFFNLSNNIA
ncbi:MAG: OpgC domain-containing protein [Colwellia sp.]|nr:OpgC domain-containing protein [Colwellia sp.]